MADLPTPRGPIPLTPAQIDALYANTTGYSLLPSQFTYSVQTARVTFPDGSMSSLPDAASVAAFRQQLGIWDALIAPDFQDRTGTDTIGYVELRAYIPGPRTTFPTVDAYSGNGISPDQPAGASNIYVPVPQGVNGENVDGSGARYVSIYGIDSAVIGHVLGISITDTSYQTLQSLSAYLPPNFIRSYYSNLSANGSSSVYTASVTIPIGGPSVLEVAAAQSRYGADQDTGAGNTTYAFQDGARSAQTLYDAGGIDTIDLSALTRGSLVDLRPGSYSSIGYSSVAEQESYWAARLGAAYASAVHDVFADPNARVYTGENNLGIAFGTIIENVTGSNVADLIIGNDAANALRGGGGQDTLTGGLGADTLTGGGDGFNVFRDALAGLNGDTITDFTLSDRLVLSDASLSDFAYTRSGQTITLAGGQKIGRAHV